MAKTSLIFLFFIILPLRLAFTVFLLDFHLLFAKYFNSMGVFFVALLCCTLVTLLKYFKSPPPVLMMDYSCYKPENDRKAGYEVGEYFVHRIRRFTPASIEFMRSIFLKSGLGDETYGPPFIFESGYEPSLRSARQEVIEGAAAAVDALFRKSDVSPSMVDILVATSGMFSTVPSLADEVAWRYGLREECRSYNLNGMGCSSGALAMDFAGRLMRSRPGPSYALVVVTEGLTLNWYFGEERSMLIANCIFRVGCVAALLTTDKSRRTTAKLELKHSLRTHQGADDFAFFSAYQHEDDAGNTGMELKKDLIRAAGDGLGIHIRHLAPHVLPLSEIAKYVYKSMFTKEKPNVPDFRTAFEHMCIHTGGKAVINAVGKNLKLDESVTEPARMTLHRFGNTSSSLVFYELAYFDAKMRIKTGDRLWMIGFGTGFKVCSLVWKALKDSRLDDDNPWKDCVHRYPLKAW